ncbi:DinB family protein [Massilia sp. 9I]|uniref:DinB family protein n=1 Tax=Massilia sp. 9I TaxID=2653152 RepID=UPI0012F32AC8|nr:DinB family protein [Massilia sp. 9I]VXC05831.1 Damage-inducible protein DinB [Massilia sp. 9I]
MPKREDIVLLAQYNATMNRQLYEAAATLPADEVSADRGAFFGSLLGTMNHLLAGDTIWLTRFALHPSAFPALEPMRSVPTPSGLTHSFGSSQEELREHRLRLDGVITAMAAEMRDADLEQVLVYRNLSGKEFQRHFGSLLLHFFNHQTHHRGQASTLLSQAGVDIGVTDLFVLLPDPAAA